MTKWLRPAAESWPGRFLSNLLRRYFIHDVGRQSAALAYYLLFMLFPFLIFLSSLLGVVESYLSYVSHTSSTAMLWFGLVFSIYFPMRAADCLMHAVRRAYHLPRPKNQILYMAKVLLYTVFLLVTIALTLALVTVGRQALHFARRFAVVPEAFIELWSDLRFLVLGAVMFAAVGLLYAAAQDTRQRPGAIVPGTLIALVGWMVVSAAFSFYVENFANYSVIYGALGTVIVLMWLNLTAAALIMGAEANGALLAMESGRKQGPRGPSAGAAAPNKEKNRQ